MTHNNSGRNVIVYIAMSLDGFIAKEDGDIEFLSMVETEGEDYGYHEFIKTVDTVIVGRKTYDKIVSLVHTFPHQDKESYIITRTKKPDQGNIKFYTGDLQSLIDQLKSKKGKHIYCDGGAEIIHELLQINQVDEFYISIIPVLLGTGIRLFKDSGPELKLKLNRSITFESGLVQLHYIRTSL
ncbi:MAG: dihydrofolate reductase [Saprospiraceae bacterium]|nr:dihydrofolate reductase [Candidatus Vicinibacter affinis]MBP6172970.1 dihydrofolate reductase [Saprospiraceae bacterium]MBK6572860.1 dihydrofolate reductase [Candidatus Vicinibacter affinis]MBK6824684.1 dihydrofolate reductase [Candidatus Vicinibacter affinis]MBK7798560.1 dihydrofolate reductase [Candidatus Vicinibacter affinis]